MHGIRTIYNESVLCHRVIFPFQNKMYLRLDKQKWFYSYTPTTKRAVLWRAQNRIVIIVYV